jgi:RHS repeat-associated protein
VFNYTLNSNRLTSQVYTNKVNATTTNYTLNTVTDIAGNITNDGNRLFTYNPLGRLSSFNYIGNTNITRYSYDIQNRRIAKIKPTTATVSATSASDTYIYAENVGGLNSTQLLGEYSNNLGSSIAVNKTEYVYLNDIPLAMVKNGVTYTIHTDHLNTPRQLTNATKQLVWNWGYTPFGDNQPNSITTSPVFNLRYPGQYYDPESKLHYNINRYYDPAMGRYTQSDPIGLNGGINTYTYVGGNAINYIDPTGLYSISELNKDINQATGGCSDDTFMNDVLNNYIETQNSIPSIVKASASFGLAGKTAGTYGGLTPIGAISGYISDPKTGSSITPGIGSRTYPQVAGTVAATSVANFVILQGMFSSGVLIGSILRSSINRGTSGSCKCEK